MTAENVDEEVVLLHQILGRRVDLPGHGLTTVVLGWPNAETMTKPGGRWWYLRVVFPGGELKTVRVDELPRPVE